MIVYKTRCIFIVFTESQNQNDCISIPSVVIDTNLILTKNKYVLCMANNFEILLFYCN